MGANNLNRVEWIDAAKGIGIWLVVTGHLLSGDSESSRMIAKIIWVFHMPLFFFLSGIASTAPHRPWAWSGLAKNVFSIVVPYLFFSIVSIALWLASNGEKYEDRNVLDAAGAVLFGVSGSTEGLFFNVPLWFFTCLFSVKLIFFCLGSACNYCPIRIMAYSVVLALFAHFAFYALPLPRLPWNFDVAIIALIFYSAGYLLSKYKFYKLSGKGSWFVLMMGIFALLLASVVNGRVDMNYRLFNSPIIFYFGAFGGIFSTIVIANWGVRFKWLAGIGIASIVIFPMHSLIAYFLPERTLSIIGWYAYRISSSMTFSAMFVGAAEVVMCIPFYWLLLRYAPTLIGRVKKAQRREPETGQGNFV